MSLDADAARAAIQPIADFLGVSLEKAALSIIHIANNNMVGALHSVLTEQGLDPRDFVLVAFGGAGPPHVSDLMTDASIPHGLVPNFPGQFSALGFIMADARVDRHRTVQLNSRFFDRERAVATMSALVKECVGASRRAGPHRRGYRTQRRDAVPRPEPRTGNPGGCRDLQRRGSGRACSPPFTISMRRASDFGWRTISRSSIFWSPASPRPASRLSGNR